MGEEHIQFLHEAYSQYLQVEYTRQCLSLGKLKELKWSVNYFKGSEKYPNLKKIYILIEFVIQNENGMIEKQVANLSLQEFKVLQGEIKEISQILSAYNKK